MNLTLALQCLDDTAFIPSEEQFAIWVEAALSHYKKNAEICIRLVDEKESAKLNKQYRQKDKSTNVLSFTSVLPPPLAQDFLLGDLVICVPIVQQEALEQNIPVLSHWAHLVIHGCMHLLGYDHELEEDAHVMEKLETNIMVSLGFDDPYKES